MSKKNNDHISDNRLGEKNTLFLHLQGLKGTVTINEDIYCHSLTIKQIRYRTSADSLHSALFLVIPSIGPSQINSNLNITSIPIILQYDYHVTGANNVGIDSISEPDITMTINKKIPKKISWSLVDVNGNPATDTNIQFVQIWCEYDSNPM